MCAPLAISKAGTADVRTLAIELACRLVPACRRFSRHERWRWIRYQPESEISRWYERRFSQGGSRMCRIVIVASSGRLVQNLTLRPTMQPDK
jgi:transposase